MPRFEVYSGGTLVGHSELESGDSPMGVAFGKFLPLPAYDLIRAFTIAHVEQRECASQTHLQLIVRDHEGRELNSCEGVKIFDYSAELGSDGLAVGPDFIEIYVIVIDRPLYEEVFPQHVAAYKDYWNEKSKIMKDNVVVSKNC